MLTGTSTALPSGPRGRPMSLEPTTSPASWPSACPACAPTMAPPSCWNIPSIGPAMACASAGRALVEASAIRAASGSIRPFHTGRVPSTHSARLQARAAEVPAGRAVTGSSQTSASRTASSTASRSVRSTEASPRAATVCRAVSWASCQLTGPSPPDCSIRPTCSSIAPRLAAFRSPGPKPKAANGLPAPAPPPSGSSGSSEGIPKPNG